MALRSRMEAAHVGAGRSPSSFQHRDRRRAVQRRQAFESCDANHRRFARRAHLAIHGAGLSPCRRRPRAHRRSGQRRPARAPAAPVADPNAPLIAARAWLSPISANAPSAASTMDTSDDANRPFSAGTASVSRRSPRAMTIPACARGARQSIPQRRARRRSRNARQRTEQSPPSRRR